MNIHKELEQLRRDHKLIADRIDEIQQQLEPEITEGQYWERNNEIKRIQKIDDSHNLSIDYKIITDTGDGGSCSKGFLTELVPHKLLCDDEVEQALIKEAKRRGLIDGIKVKRPSTYLTMQTTGIINRELSTKYVTSCDRLEFGGVTVYQEAEWAEIIEDEWEVGKYDTKGDCYYVTNGSREIDGTYEALSKKEAQAIANALNNLDND